METRWWRSWWWRSWCHAGDVDDHGAPKMEIKRSNMILAISCHYLITCDVYHVFASCLLRTTVVNKMIPHKKFQESVPPNCAPLRQFVVSKHHVMIGCDRFQCSHTTGVSQIYTRKHLGWLDEPSMYRHGLGPQETERSNMSRIEDTINMKMFTDVD